MSRWGLGIGAALVMWAATAAAEPYFAVREGQKCSACHINMTGGGMRTSFVSAHAKEILHYPNWLPELTKPADHFTGEINQYVGIGADLRVDMTAIMQDKLLQNSTLIIYPGFSHGMLTVNADVVNADLLKFIRS